MPDYIKLKMKERTIPIEIEGLHELLRRIPATDGKIKEYLLQQLARMEAGHRGEVKVDQKLMTLPMPYLHEVIPNFTTRNSYGSHYQLDTVLVTNRYVLYLEVKNIRGTIEFMTNPQQLKRTLEGKVDFMSCPLVQTKRNHQSLQYLIRQYHSKLPVFSAIVFTSSSATVLSQQHDVQIVYRRQLDHYLGKLNTLPEILDKPSFQKLVKKLKQATQNFHPEALVVRYNMDPASLRTGIFCTSCEGHMVPATPSYKCSACHKTDPLSLRRTIRALFTILGPHQQVRNFKHHMALSNKGPIIRSLKHIPTERVGTTKNSMYTLKPK